MRGDDFEPCRLRRLDLRLEEARIGPRQQIDEIELVVDRVVEALHPLRRLTLVLPYFQSEADILRDLGHARLDRLDERHRARSRDGEDRLALHAGGGVERLARRLEGRELSIGLELLLGLGGLGAFRERRSGEQLNSRDDARGGDAALHGSLLPSSMATNRASPIARAGSMPDSPGQGNINYVFEMQSLCEGAPCGEPGQRKRSGSGGMEGVDEDRAIADLRTLAR